MPASQTYRVSAMILAVNGEITGGSPGNSYHGHDHGKPLLACLPPFPYNAAMSMPSEYSLSATPLVSVVLPTYNRASFLGQSIQSVFRQSYSTLELIVVDDGSTDHTRDLVASMAPMARYVWQPHAGAAAARNLGLREARGELIAFIDSDDLWREDKLTRQIDFLRANPSVGLVYGGRRTIDEQGSFLRAKFKPLRSGCVTESLFGSMFITMPSVLVRREVVERVGEFDPRLRVAEDYDYWLRASLVTRLGAIDEPLVDVRRLPDRLTAAKGDGALVQYQMRLRFYQEQGGAEAIRPAVARRALARSARKAAQALLGEGRAAMAERMFEASLEHRFTLRAAWMRFTLWARRRLARGLGRWALEPIR